MKILRRSGISAVAGAPLLFPAMQGPTLRISGISHASRAFSLSARRGGPCKADGGKLWQGVTRPGEAAILFSSHTIESKLSYGVATKQNQHRFRDADSL